MNNANMNRFTINPTSLDTKRSRFSRPFKHTTTFDAGKLIPFYLEEVLPGDSVSLDLSCLVRQTTPIHPTMDNSYLEFHFYFVPNRLVWEHWENFMGQNDTSSPWLPPTSYSIPQIVVDNASKVQSGKVGSANSDLGIDVGSVMDYMGLPVYSVTSSNNNQYNQFSVSALPFRGYALIWNQWYRDEGIMAPVNISFGDSISVFSNEGLASTGTHTYSNYINNGTYVSNGSVGGAPLPVCKFHDYFTSALKAPQRGPDVTLPLGTFAPIVNNSSASLLSPTFYNYSAGTAITGGFDLHAKAATTGLTGSTRTPDASDQTLGLRLSADLSNATAATINTIRWAFQLQKYYEKLARGGSRYNEFIQSFFGVHVPDERLQRTEFLGGRRIPLNIQQVPQTSSTDSTTPQGNLAAYGQTGDNHSYFTKSFVEHGFLFGLLMVRTDRTYQQGINRMWKRNDVIDFYNPVFANIGEQPIKNTEIYFDKTSSGSNTNNGVFGYQEAWAEYRYSPNRVSGEFHSGITTPLDSWHYADNYTSTPTLSTGWLVEPQSNVQRTLAVSGVPQYMADIQVSSVWTRVMPLYSIPGLVDHH